MKSNVKWSVLSAAVLVTLSSAAAISAQSDNGRDRYAEGIYADFSTASDSAVSFDVRTVASRILARIAPTITPQILGGNTELTLPQLIMLQLGRSGNFPLASALSVVLMAVVTLAYFASSRWLRLDRV